MKYNPAFHEKLRKIADNFYSGKTPEELLSHPDDKHVFLKELIRYRKYIAKQAEQSKFRWFDHTVISEQFPPVHSEIEKNYLINTMMPKRYSQRSITVAISYGCACNCKQCYRTEYMDPSRKELSVEQFGVLFKKVTDMGVWHLDITGGEPFDHPQFFEIMDQIPKDKATTMVATNGINLNQETIDRIKHSNIMVLKVSLDSYKKAEHDKNRAVEDAYDLVVSGIQRALENNIYVFVQAFVQRDCWKDNELEKRIQVCLELGIKKFHIITPLNIGNLSKRKDLLLTAEDREYIYGLRDKYKDSDTYISVFPDWELFSGCLSGRGRIYINPYGDIYPCNFDNEKCYGNILTHELPDVIKSMQEDIPEKRHSCVASDITLDALKKLGAKSNIIYGRNRSSFHFVESEKKKNLKQNGEYDCTETKLAKLYIEKNYLDDDEAQKISHSIDKGIRDVSEYLKIEAHNPIEYYIKSGEFISYSGSGYAVLSGIRKHVSPYLHETVHVIAGIHQDCYWLSEGLAVYLNEKLGGYACYPNGAMPLDECVKNKRANPEYQNFRLNLETQHDDSLFTDESLRRLYYVFAGSFVKYLDKRIGIEKLMKLYNSENCEKAFLAVANQSVDEYKREWEQHLGIVDKVSV
jgi:MoaA/NifB/PqqE/SkfB family radical SAM enzyme